MTNYNKLYINGDWVNPKGTERIAVSNPADEKIISEIIFANKDDLDLAVLSAKKAFNSFSTINLEEKIELFNSIILSFKKRLNDLAEIISLEMGAPITLSQKAQAPSGLGHFINTLNVLKKFEFEEVFDTYIVRKEPKGVCGLITPWNWPINQITCKVAPALAAGCTLILKPSEVAPLSSVIFAEILHDAGVPKGVFNLIQGDSKIGTAMSEHVSIDMISFTGSTRAGVAVAKNSANTVKRVTQELGGKSANIILEDADFEKSIKKGILSCMSNSGQSCNAPSRMLIPIEKMDNAINLAKEISKGIVVGDPKKAETTLGPLVNEIQYNKVKDYIEKGIKEGATLVVGGNGMPDNVDKGFFVKPTIFANVKNSMTIAKEEIFGPVLAIIPYDTEEEAIEIANDSIFGLSGAVWSGDDERAKRVAKKIRTGQVSVNGGSFNVAAPFGGYKQSGIGRELGPHGLTEFTELKSMQL